MSNHRDTIKHTILEEIQRLAAECGNDASGLTDDALIPALGLLDSISTLALVAWIETKFRLSIPEEDFNIDHFGTLDAMTQYIVIHGHATNN